MISGITLHGQAITAVKFQESNKDEVSGCILETSENFFEKTKIKLDKCYLRAIISVFCLSRRYSSIGRATDL